MICYRRWLMALLLLVVSCGKLSAATDIFQTGEDWLK
jgi:hypothetical protein